VDNVEIAKSGPPVKFELAFAGPCGEQIEGAGGAPFSTVVGCTLTTLANTTGEGAQGWSIGMAAEGLVIADITTAGTVAADAEFQVNEITTGPGNEGAVSAVVLSFTEPITLPPLGTETIATIDVEGEFPPGETCQDALLFYRDGLQGSGEPVRNIITHLTLTRTPNLLDCPFQPCGLISGDFLRGDVNADGSIDITDPVSLAGYLFLGQPQTLPCLDAADIDDSGALDLTDAVYVASWLFMGGPRPPAPSPSAPNWLPQDCGPDVPPGSTDNDGMKCASFWRCP
jgi:hypothetical protein